FTFDDTGEGWHPTTDGDGYSLVILDARGPLDSWNDGASWRPSHAWGGSPGKPDRLPGDVDGNDRVNLADLAIVQAHFGTSAGAARAQGDLDGDGDVDRADAAVLARNFGRAYPPNSASPAAAPAAVIARTDRRGGDELVERAADGRLLATAVRRNAAVRAGTLVATHVDRAVSDFADETAAVDRVALRARRLTRSAAGIR
ncbi:MAG: hypothetical protein DCC68_09090, partial [Planctomycetota bacterium]